MKPEKEYVRLMALNRVNFYKDEIRPSQNEWIVNDMEEWIDEVKVAAYQAEQQGLISRKDYQEIVSAAVTGLEAILLLVAEYEEADDYINRLVSNND